MKNQAGPMLDAAVAGLIADLDERGLLAETLAVAVGEFGRSPQRGLSTSGNQNKDDGRDHWPYCFTACFAGAAVKRAFVYGKSDKTASAPVESPVHPTDLLATIYHCVGIDPATIVYNHLNQPRELVQRRPSRGSCRSGFPA
jgi:arylsulfatase A-like enzyme